MFSIINHPFWGIPIFGNTHIWRTTLLGTERSHGPLLNILFEDYSYRWCSLKPQVGEPLKEIMFFWYVFKIVWFFLHAITVMVPRYFEQNMFLFFAASCLVGAGCGGLNSVRRIGKTAWKLQLGTTSFFAHFEGPRSNIVSHEIYWFLQQFMEQSTDLQQETPSAEFQCRTQMQVGFLGISSTTSWHVHLLYGTTFCWSDPHPLSILLIRSLIGACIIQCFNQSLLGGSSHLVSA